MKDTGVTYLLGVPYRSSESDLNNEYQIRYYPHKPKSSPLDIKIVDDEHVMDLFLKHQVPSEGSFVPETMEIRGSNGKNDNPETRRIVILSRDRLHYQVFKLPSPDIAMKDLEEDIPMS
jgi:anaphase-promoting complex subunit 4